MEEIRTQHRREACRSCPIDPNSGVCREHRMVISSSRWVLGIIFTLLVATLGSVIGTFIMLANEVSVVQSTAAVTNSKVMRLEADMAEIHRDVKQHMTTYPLRKTQP